jgi:hypothetical protein
MTLYSLLLIVRPDVAKEMTASQRARLQRVPATTLWRWQEGVGNNHKWNFSERPYKYIAGAKANRRYVVVEAPTE